MIQIQNFLKYCSNEDLDLLVTYLIKDKDGNPRLTEELTYTDEYKLYSPNHKTVLAINSC